MKHPCEKPRIAAGTRWGGSPRVGAVLAVLLATAAPAFAQSPAEIEFWKSVQNSKNAAELQAYLQAFPHGKFVPLARLRITELTGKPPPGPAQPSPAPSAMQETPARRPESTTTQRTPSPPSPAPAPPTTTAKEATPPASPTLAAHAGTSLSAAIRAGDMGAVKAALAHGADVNGLDDSGMPPIGLAALLGKPAIIAYLAANGADVNRNDRYGFTPLMDAAIRGHPEAARMLLALGADPVLHGANGNDPAGVAKPYGHADPHYAGKIAVMKVLGDAMGARTRLGVPPDRASAEPERHSSFPAIPGPANTARSSASAG